MNRMYRRHLGAILLTFFLAFMLGACAGTKSAYEEATGIYENAIILGHHYKAMQQEAILLGTTGSLAEKTAIKEANRRASPIIKAMIRTAAEYNDIKLQIEAGEDLDEKLRTTSADLSSLIARASYALTSLFNAIRGVSS